MFDVKKLKIKKQPSLISTRSKTYMDILIELTINKDNEKIKGTIKEVVQKLQKKDIKKNHLTLFKIAAKIEASRKYDVKFVKKQDNEKFNVLKSKKARKLFIDRNPQLNKKIVMFNLYGKPVKGFDNTAEIMVYLKKPIHHWVMINFCKGKKYIMAKHLYGYNWKFLNDVLIK